MSTPEIVPSVPIGDGMAPLAHRLHSAGPHPAWAERLAEFGQFVGSWDLTWTGRTDDPALQSMAGEVHFGWVLAGRAVQDVWIMPAEGAADASPPPRAFFGSTLRFFDPSIDAWRSTWIEPINGRVRRFIGRPRGGEIILLSDEDEPQLRWRFLDITPQHFTWRGERSDDGGRTWYLEEEMHATRRSGNPAGSAVS